MKRILLFLPFMLLANSIPMPPMPPAMNFDKPKKKIKTNSKVSMPKECEMIPPMIIFLPPPLEDALTKCKNKLFEPKLEFAKKVFAKKKLKVKSINIVKGFNELYEIKTNKGNFYCNKDLTKCFKVKDE